METAGLDNVWLGVGVAMETDGRVESALMTCSNDAAALFASPAAEKRITMRPVPVIVRSVPFNEAGPETTCITTDPGPLVVAPLRSSTEPTPANVGSVGSESIWRLPRISKLRVTLTAARVESPGCETRILAVPIASGVTILPARPMIEGVRFSTVTESPALVLGSRGIMNGASFRKCASISGKVMLCAVRRSPSFATYARPTAVTLVFTAVAVISQPLPSDATFGPNWPVVIAGVPRSAAVP